MIVIIGTGTIAHELVKYFEANDMRYKNIPYRDNIAIISAINSIPVKIDAIILTAGYLVKKDFEDLNNDDIVKMANGNLVHHMTVINNIYERIKKDKSYVTVFSSSVIDNYRDEYLAYYIFKKALENFMEKISKDIKTIIVRNNRTDTKLRWNNYEKNEITTKNLLTPLNVVKTLINFIHTEPNNCVLKIYKENEKIKQEIVDYDTHSLSL